MPTLDFKGKQIVYAHHLTVPARTLEVDVEKSRPPKDHKPSLGDNLIIHGDNLHALKALMPRYAGRVNCIYIDPPYNNGLTLCWLKIHRSTDRLIATGLLGLWPVYPSWPTSDSIRHS